MTEGCGFRDHYAQLQALGVALYGVSFDKPAENKLFSFNNSFPFRLLSDPKRELALAYGAASTAGQLFADRVSVVLTPAGRWLVRYPDVDVVAHPQQVVDDVRAILGLTGTP